MNRKIFFDEIRNHQFKKLTQSTIDNCNVILDAWEKYAPNSDTRFIAYSLGTVLRECGVKMAPIPEYGLGRGRAYGKPVGVFKKVYYGRGYVQLTWDYNYKKAMNELKKAGVLQEGEDLLADPDLVLKPDIAARILVYGMLEGWFTGRKLADYFRGTRSDWVDARRIINGTDHAALVGSYGMMFYHAIEAATKG